MNAYARKTMSAVSEDLAPALHVAHGEHRQHPRHHRREGELEVVPEDHPAQARQRHGGEHPHPRVEDGRERIEPRATGTAKLGAVREPHDHAEEAR
jgi:hypothetical protein